MAAKTWDADFRAEAIRASIGRIGDGPREDVFDLPGSFCLPVAERPLVGWTPGVFFLIAMIIGFLLLGAGALLASVADNHKDGSNRTLLMIAAGVCSVSGIGTLLLAVKSDRLIMRWLVGDRGRRLLERTRETPLLAAEISDADRSSMKLSISGTDHALILPDKGNRRVLIEGIGARYQIRAEDVERIAPFQFMNHLGVEIVYRVDPEVRLRLAIARTSLLAELIRQLPVLFFLRNKVPNRLFDRFSECVGPG